MRTPTSALLPLFRSRAQESVLRLLFLRGADDGWPLSELAREAGLSKSQVHREVERLERAGIVTSERIGRIRIVRPNRESPYHDDLASLLETAFGPVPVLRELLASVAGVDAAYIFGSWASRYVGEPGPPPADVDVLVVGDPRPADVYRAARAAELRLGRSVNPTIVPRHRWAKPNAAFLRTVRERPRIKVA